MKNLIKFAAVLFAAAFVSCSSKYAAVYKDHPPIIDRPNYAIFEETVGGCEYLILDGSYSGGIIHKSNCKNHSKND